MTKEEAIAKYKTAATLEEDHGSIWATPSAIGPLVVLSVSRREAMPVVLVPGVKFRIRGTLHVPTDVLPGITTHTRQGGFAGKFSLTLSAEKLRATRGSFDVELPLSAFQPDPRSPGELPFGNELTEWWCFSRDRKAKIEITALELLRQYIGSKTAQPRK